MNPAFGFQELIVIVILALVVVGPKDLPLMVRRVGKMIGQIRATAREFQRSFDELGREAELAELRKEISSLKDHNPIKEMERDFLEADRDVQRELLLFYLNCSPVIQEYLRAETVLSEGHFLSR